MLSAWVWVMLLVPTCLIGQDSVIDSGFTETEVFIDTSLQSIYGTLTMPEATGKIPVVLIISGSGPTDRNGNNPFGLSTDSYQLLARSLALNKIASLRFDKRGVAKSISALADEKMLTVGTYVNDGESWIKWLRKDKRFSKIIVLGHSEGALIGTLVTNFQRADGFISISGSGIRADSLIIQQLSKQSPALADTAKVIIDHIKKGEAFYVNKDLAPIFRPDVANYLRSWFKLSPVVEISLLRCPVIVIQGTYDLQVSVGEAKLLAEARPGAMLVIIDKMNHVMKNAPDDIQGNISTYKNRELPLSDQLTPAITEFIKSVH